MTKITASDVQKLARLSRLKLEQEEVAQYQKELSAILEYVEQLSSVDVAKLQPTSQVTGLKNVVRADEKIDYGVTSQDLLKNAPATQDSHFKVKRMLS
jgi:aspartyl-tRNA(Asn)/glutamyl-tRNA(Gln) amidotransferase subunit C